MRVEVKGTRGDGESIEVTIGEVENARGSAWRTDLFLVTGIELSRADGQIEASGGAARIIEGWRPVEAELSPIRFRCVVPPLRPGQ